jgi:hypothetical protein
MYWLKIIMLAKAKLVYSYPSGGTTYSKNIDVTIEGLNLKINHTS